MDDVSKPNKYLVSYKDNDGELMEPVIETARPIFNTMDMSDCSGIRIARLWHIDGINLTECVFYDTWHNPKDPLRMEIRVMCPATPEQYEPLDVGYGTDH